MLIVEPTTARLTRRLHKQFHEMSLTEDNKNYLGKHSYQRMVNLQITKIITEKTVDNKT